MMFLKALPFIFVYIGLMLILTLINDWLRLSIDTLLKILVVPMLTINFFNKETVASLFEFKILKAVFNNFGDYLMTILKSIGLALIFFAMWIILVGIPAGSFTKNIFLADFYRRRIK